MKKIVSTLIATFLVSGFVFSQRAQAPVHVDPGHLTCGQHAATEAFHEANPEARELTGEKRMSIFNELKENGLIGGSRDADYIIPVVFHVIHYGGIENISDAQIHDAIDVMNEDFSASNSGVNTVQSAFEDIVADVNVEFRLAKKDPQGNCTNGINRVYSIGTFDGGEDVKTGDASTWGRTKYLNIWVVKNMSGGSAGYAYIPGYGPSSGDGIIILHDYVGSIGTSNDNRSHALSHEAGHWAGLEHLWGWSNSPELSTNCNMDDGLDDTPLSIGWTECDLDGESCGSLDNVENFMEYAYCSKMFTQDQSDLMRYVLENGRLFPGAPYAGREQLSSASNLSNTGVLDPDVVCHVDFTTNDEPIVCPGQELEFTDLSFNGVTTREWTFEGGTPATSSAASPEVSWSEPGVYDVTLTAGNANGSETSTKVGFVTVIETGENDIPFEEGFESFTSLEDNDENWFVLDQGDQDEKWELRDDVAYAGSNCVYVRGRYNSNNAKEVLSSPTFDLSGVSENAVLKFKYAHARRMGSSDDQLKVLISKNCGDLWSVRKTLDIDDLPTVSGNVTGEFEPDGQDEWAEVSIDNIVSVFLNEEFRVRFEYTSYRGNNIYIDNINIYDPATVGIDGVDFVNKFDVYPNPTTGATTLMYGLEKSSDMRVDVMDISGRIVQNVYSGFQASGDHVVDMNLSILVPGVYLVQIQSGGEQIIRKLVKQ